jgi:hypothetical protein
MLLFLCFLLDELDSAKAQDIRLTRKNTLLASGKFTPLPKSTEGSKLPAQVYLIFHQIGRGVIS